MPEDYEELIARLIANSSESQTVEFKESNDDAFMIGKDISALANSAVIEGQDYAYMVWGVRDDTHEVVGTTFNPLTAKHSRQELELWLRLKLSKNAEFRFIRTTFRNKPMVVLRIWPAAGYPVSFDGMEYIRSGTSTQPVAKNSQREQRLWEITKSESFEDQIALQWLREDEVLALLDWDRYFKQTDTPVPANRLAILHFLETDRIVKQLDSGQYAVTNLGALLFATDMQRFPTVARKALRIIRYDGSRRSAPSRSKIWSAGYADMDAIIDYVEALLPEREEIRRALRVTLKGYPTLAVRELVANMLIHQDLTIRGAGPLIEIFDGRIEFSNPGNSLIRVERLVNDPPATRNPRLASLARRLHMCEEAGSGWDKIIDACEEAQLPSPEVQQSEGDAPSMSVRLLQHKAFADMSGEERRQACYWHACVQYANSQALTNASLRERFGMADSGTSQISRLIRECVDNGLIRPVDADAARKKMRYVPAWA